MPYHSQENKQALHKRIKKKYCIFNGTDGTENKEGTGNVCTEFEL
jgi:hypothetical protein